MSGLDLAPFVAAVFEDGAVAGLLQENDELKSRLTESKNERLVVQVTGKNGSPIHYEGSLKNAKRFGNDIGTDGLVVISLYFDNGSSHDLTTDGFPLSSLNQIEIRLGGVVVQRINIDDLNITFVDHSDEENRLEYITLHNNINRRPNGSGPISLMHGIIGPLPLGWGQRHTGGDDIALTDLLEEVADENNELTPQTLIINGLVFRVKDITGMACKQCMLTADG